MKHQDIISKMTLKEKAAFLNGQNEWQTWDFPRLDIPAMNMSDGPHGIRKQAGEGDHLGLGGSLPATCFPTAATIANSWEESLGTEIGEALGEEALAEDVQILLGPGMNIKRSPLCGRNFEYFSEDPYLAGKMASSYVKGIQSKGVRSCIKHFAVNSQETRRMAMDAIVDERTFREIYLTGFEMAVKDGGAKAIMTAYNMINGEYANENQHLLVDILRKDWGFDGVVITDWGGSNDHVAGVKAGSELEMPTPGLDSARILIKAVEEGKLEESVIDERVDALLDAVLETSKAYKAYGSDKFDEAAHHAIARKAAAHSAVLLKNDGDILPLQKGVKAAIIGDFAFDPRYQGAGSSVVNCTQLDTLEKLAASEDTFDVVQMARGYKRTGEDDAALLEEAKSVAAAADVVLYCFGLDEMSESEGLDRGHMRIPANQIAVLEAINEVNKNVVGVISAGSSIEMPWENNCKAILHAYLGGQGGAGAILDLVTGRENPSGKLAETYPLAYEDVSSTPYYPAEQRNSEYREGIYVGYRYFQKKKKAVRYPFGFGLSYTTFEYSDLQVSEDGVTFTVTNTGKTDGAEVAQMYIALPNAKIFRPEQELKGFAKVFLKAGESKKVTIAFDERSFRYWNNADDCWEVEGGTYEIRIGASCEDIRLTAAKEVAAVGKNTLPDASVLASYYSGDIEAVSDAEFKALYGREIPKGEWDGVLTSNDAICQLYYAKSGLARFVYNRLASMKKKSEDAGKPDLNILFIWNMPFRAIAKMSGGMVSMEMVDSIMKMVNGHFWGGLGGVIGGFFRNRSANKKYVAEMREGK